MTEQDWTDFSFPDVFDGIQRGKRLKKADHAPGDVPYVSSTALNNGVDGFIAEAAGTRAFEDCLSIANSGSVGTVFYEPFRYVASDHVTSLKREGASKQLYLFMATSASEQAVNFNFNREINDVRIRKLRLMLPVNRDGQPDCESMEASVKERERRLLDRYLAYARQRLAEREFSMTGDFALSIKDRKWAVFILGDLADIQSGQDIYKAQRIEGNTPYVTAGSQNNGIGYFVGNDNGSKSRNVISVNRNGAVGESFYHPYYALFGNDCRRVFLNGSPSEYVQLFMTCCISNQKSTFGYSRKLGTERLERMKVLLPVDSSGKPDWAFMDTFMKERERKLLSAYIAYIQARISTTDPRE